MAFYTHQFIANSIFLNELIVFILECQLFFYFISFFVGQFIGLAVRTFQNKGVTSSSV